MDKKLLDQQSQHWESSFSSKPEMFGLEPSEAARYAKETFENQKVKTFFSRKKIDILELKIKFLMNLQTFSRSMHKSLSSKRNWEKLNQKWAHQGF